MSYTIDGHALGTITQERINKDAQLFQMPLPRTDSDKLIALDLFGVQRTITLDAVWTVVNGDIPTFLTWLDGLVNGEQITKVYATDTTGTSYNVFVNTVDYRRAEGEVNLITYSITMLEAKQVTS